MIYDVVFDEEEIGIKTTIYGFNSVEEALEELNLYDAFKRWTGGGVEERILSNFNYGQMAVLFNHDSRFYQMPLIVYDKTGRVNSAMYGDFRPDVEAFVKKVYKQHTFTVIHMKPIKGSK